MGKASKPALRMLKSTGRQRQRFGWATLPAKATAVWPTKASKSKPCSPQVSALRPTRSSSAGAGGCAAMGALAASADCCVTTSNSLANFGGKPSSVTVPASPRSRCNKLCRIHAPAVSSASMREPSTVACAAVSAGTASSCS